jgi:phosphoribosylamine---glycine ligase
VRVLVVGGGGREHALVWKISQSPLVKQVFCAPGNGGIAQDAECLPLTVVSTEAVVKLVEENAIDLVMVGPEAPLVAGIVDDLQAQGILVAGPSKAAAQLEGSKIYAKHFMQRYSIPTADFVVCSDVATAMQHANRWGGPAVVKADGLAAGKGVVVSATLPGTQTAIQSVLSGELVGAAGNQIVLEEVLAGEEVSFMVLTDGEVALPLAPTQDHKRVGDGDTGPNTGGMGAYCDDSIISAALKQRVMDQIVYPTLRGMKAEGAPFRGVLYCGLMITPDGPKVLEYNVRFGDPETQAILYRMDSDLAQILLEIAKGRLETASVRSAAGASVCVVACSGGYPGNYTAGIPIHGLEAAEQAGVKIFHSGTARSESCVKTAGGRVLGITASGAHLTAALNTAYAAAKKIHFEGMHFRSDIGQKGLLRKQPLA